MKGGFIARARTGELTLSVSAPEKVGSVAIEPAAAINGVRASAAITMAVVSAAKRRVADAVVFGAYPVMAAMPNSPSLSASP